MAQFSDQRILGSVAPSNFVGRSKDLERLMLHAQNLDGAKGLALLAAPNAGSSELLKQTFDRLFSEQEEIIPIYFAIKKSDGFALQTARRFLREMLIQTVAFRRRNAFVLDSAPDINEIAELAVPTDALWIDRLIETAGEYGNDDPSSRLRSFLASPLRAAASGAQLLVMIDDLHEIEYLPDGNAFLEAVTEIFGRSETPFLLCGHRRFLYGKTPFESAPLNKLSFADAGTLAESLANKFGISLTEQTRDLIAVQLKGHTAFMDFIFAAAADKGSNFDSFQQFETVYADEILAGRITRHFDEIFDRLIADRASQRQVIGILADLFSGEVNRISLDFWNSHSGLSVEASQSLAAALHELEIVSVSSDSIEISTDDIVLADYITTRNRLVSAENLRGQIVGEVLSSYIKRAPRLMAKFYRQLSAIGLREVMAAFDGRDVASSLIDYGKFKEDLKGLSDADLQANLASSNETATLPQIVYTAHSVAFYKQIGELMDAERSAIALGFEQGETQEEIVWIAAEIDSKLEAATDLVEFWCDRLEMVAASCDFASYKIWLVAPEGFSPESLQILKDRNAVGSSRKQVDLLVRHLNAEVALDADSGTNEYEIVIPMGEDTEMIAAHTIEEIAKRHNFPAKTINQIKTALVEACINASEHSMSPDRKIYQKFSITDEKVVITISNRGLRLADKAATQVTSPTGRRGWGLKLIEGLMDEVKLEQTDDGTRITMVKFVSR